MMEADMVRKKYDVILEMLKKETLSGSSIDKKETLIF
jgi:hypothetical protein